MNIGSVLYVYKGEYGLPSIDFECLRALCLVKFTRCPIRIDTSGSPLRSSANKLPFLQIGNEKFFGYRQIKKVLDKEGFCVDNNLPAKTKHLSAAWNEWAFTNLHAYFNYYLFGEPSNYDDCTRGLYARRTPFPFNFYYPGSYQKDAANIVRVMSNFDIHDKLDQHSTDYLTYDAKVSVNTLSRKLGKKVWFFGDVYSEFDAIVYAYLSIIYKIQLPNNPLQTHIKGCQNLVNFINRISRDVFKHEAFTSSKLSKSFPQGENIMTLSEHRLKESETKTKVLASIGAIVAMSAFYTWRQFSSGYSNTRHSNYSSGFEYDDDDDDDENID